jgi:hypothetical protein
MRGHKGDPWEKRVRDHCRDSFREVMRARGLQQGKEPYQVFAAVKRTR